MFDSVICLSVTQVNEEENLPKILANYIFTSVCGSSVNTVKVIMALYKDHVPTTVCFSYFSVSACDIKCVETEMVLLIDNLCKQHVY